MGDSEFQFLRKLFTYLNWFNQYPPSQSGITTRHVCVGRAELFYLPTTAPTAAFGVT